uniref:DM domain-containing protein n=1 Tax=Panagrellus redivivus TaxID=6233 RepID=A0A7E4UYH4_PANRE
MIETADNVSKSGQSFLPSLQYGYESGLSPQLDDDYSDDEGVGDVDGENKGRVSSNKGRQLYCRKCLGHNVTVMLKGHTAVCPYISCDCKSCSRLMRMRKSAFMRRYRSALGTTDPEKVNVVPFTLFPNANTRFVLQVQPGDQESDENFKGGNNNTFSFTNESNSPPDLTSIENKQSNSFQKGFNHSDPAATNTGTDTYSSTSPPQFAQVNRDGLTLPFDVSGVRDVMTPTTNNNVPEAVIAGQNSPSKNQPLVGAPVRPLIAGVPNMISEIPAQRELLGVYPMTNQGADLQAQQLLYLQQQQHALQNNRFAAAGGNASPPRGPPPLQMNPASQQQMAGLRGKRPSQVDQAFPPPEPVHKRSLGNFPGTGLPLNLNQLNGLNPQQQLALMHMHQQGLASSTGLPMQAMQPPRPPGGQQPPRMNYNAPGFAPPFNPQTNGQMANIVAMINNNQQRANMEEHMRRQKELMQMQQAQQPEHPVLHVAPPVRHEDPSRVIRAPVHLHQQPQHHLLAVQNEQRRRSLSGAIPTATQQQQYNLQLAVAQVAAVQAQQTLASAANAAASAAAAVPSTAPPPQPRASPVVSLPKTPSSAYLLSPSNAQRSTPSSIASNNHSTNIGPDDTRYQQFLRAVELFNKGIVEDEATMVQHFDIPSPVAHAAGAAFRANIPMPPPSSSFEVAKKNSMTHHEPSASTNDHHKPGQSSSDPIVIVDNQV